MQNAKCKMQNANTIIIYCKYRKSSGLHHPAKKAYQPSKMFTQCCAIFVTKLNLLYGHNIYSGQYLSWLPAD